MKKLLLILSISLFLCQSVFSQENESPVFYKLFLSCSYGNTAPNDINNLYNSITDNYKSLGIPIQTQKGFGGMLMANAGLQVSMLKDINAGISFGYSYKPAFSKYKDYAGSLNIDGSIKVFELLLLAEYIPSKIGIFPVIIGTQVGFCHTSAQIVEELRLSDFSEFNYDRKISMDGWGPCLQITIGTSISLGVFIVALEGGYEQSWNQSTEQLEESTTGTEKLAPKINIGLNGFIFDLSFGIQF